MTCPPKRRRCVGRGRGLAAAAIGACLAAGCGRDEPPAVKPQAATAAPAATGAAVPHGDHNPHFGGIVLMNGDEHFEVVLGRDGRARVYFSDAMRNELPAATATNVTVTLTPKGQPPDVIALHIDDSGESWVGQGRPVPEGDVTARIAYTSHGAPYFIDVPFPR